MRVDTHVASRPAQRLALAIGDVLLRLRITILLGHTKVDDMDYCRPLDELCFRKATLQSAPFAFLVPGRPIKKLSGLMSR